MSNELMSNASILYCVIIYVIFVSVSSLGISGVRSCSKTTKTSNLHPDLMQRRALHQLKRSRVDLAVVKVDLLIELHLFPLCNLRSKDTEKKREEHQQVLLLTGVEA